MKAYVSYACINMQPFRCRSVDHSDWRVADVSRVRHSKRKKIENFIEASGISFRLQFSWPNCGVNHKKGRLLMSVLKSFAALVQRLSRMLWRGTLWVGRQVSESVPVVIKCTACVFTVIAGVVLVLAATHVTMLLALVGTGTTIAVLIASIGLFVSTIGVLIAALRYVAERNAGVKAPDQSRGGHQANIPMRQQQNKWDG